MSSISLIMPEITIKSIIENTTNNKVILPNFQREFKWNRDAQKTLLSSILTDIPIGSVLLLSGNAKDFNSRAMCYNSPLTGISPDKDVQFLLDGQQRFSCIKSFFFDLFDKSNKHPKVFDKLKTRWFYQFKEENDFLGLDSFFFDKHKIANSVPSDVLKNIEYERDILNNSFYGTAKGDLKTEKALEYYKEKKRVPFQLLTTDFDYDLLIYNIGQSYKESVLTKLNSSDQKSQAKVILSKILNDIPEKKLELLITNYLDNDAKSNSDLEVQITLKQNRWGSSVAGFFRQILEKKINTLEIDSSKINKASVIFEYINRGGTPLSVYDLLVAKHNELNITEYIKEKIADDTFYHNCIHNWKPDCFGIIENDELTKRFQEHFVNVVALLALETKDSFDKIRVDSIKKEAILNLNTEDIEKVLETSLKGLLSAYYFLNVEVRVRNIKEVPYELMVLPIAYVYAHNIDSEESKFKKKLIYYYYVSIFSGRYSKDQNSRIIEDLFMLKKWIFDDESPSEMWGYESKRFRNILNVDDYVTDEILLNKDKAVSLNKGVKNTILSYILRRKPDDFYIDGKGFPGPLSMNSIIDKELNLELHHIIPISKGKKNIKESTSALRKNKNHILNSIANLTYISKEANRTIDAISPDKYLNWLNNSQKSQVLSSHLIPNNLLKDLETANGQNKFCKKRMEMIKNSIAEDMRQIWNEF